MSQSSGDDFSKLEFDGWQRVANKYMQLWAGLTQGFIEPLLDAAGVSEGMRVLDVACGPGIVSEKIYQRHALPVGIDFSPEMIAIARNLYPQLKFIKADAQDLPLEDSSFDSVVMNFGILHLPEPGKAMREANRVLKSGGRFAFSVWAGANSPASKVMTDAKEKFGDMSVPMPAAPPYNYFEDKEHCIEFLRDAGFDPRTIQYDIRMVTWKVPTAGYLFDAELNSGVRNAAFLRLQTKESLEKIKHAAEEGMQQFKVSDGYDLPFSACIIAASKS